MSKEEKFLKKLKVDELTKESERRRTADFAVLFGNTSLARTQILVDAELARREASNKKSADPRQGRRATK